MLTGYFRFWAIWVIFVATLASGCADPAPGEAAADFFNTEMLDSDDGVVPVEESDYAIQAAGPDGGTLAALTRINDTLLTEERGPAHQLQIDGTIHTGYPYAGQVYEGVWGESFAYDLDQYPLTWAIAAVHASLLYQLQGIDFSPNAVLALAIRASRLECANPLSSASTMGCFGLDKTRAWVDLQRIFPHRFVGGYEATLTGDQFEMAALGSVHYVLFLDAMMEMHLADPETFFAEHPDMDAHTKVLFAAYKNGAWWEPIGSGFGECVDPDVNNCFGDDVTSDFTTSILHYTQGLDDARDFDRAVTLADMYDYWKRIAPLYPEVDGDEAMGMLEAGFARAANGDSTLSFHWDLGEALAYLVAFLPGTGTRGEIVEQACRYYGASFTEGTCLQTQ